MWIAQAYLCQASLRVSVDQQEFSFQICAKPIPEIGTGGGFANAAFLVGDGDDFACSLTSPHFELLLLLLEIRKKPPLQKIKVKRRLFLSPEYEFLK